MQGRETETVCYWNIELYSASKKKSTSFIHVQLTRCQEFCQSSHFSVNLVPVKCPVTVSLVKHYFRTTRERKKRMKYSGKDRKKRVSIYLLSNMVS